MIISQETETAQPVPYSEMEARARTVSNRLQMLRLKGFSGPSASSSVFLSCLLVFCLPALANGHTFQDSGGGFLAGITHPVLGFDHFLAMLCVGILSAQIGGRAIWTVPLTFVSIMGMGGLLGMRDIALPAVEYGIAFSVLVLGVALALGKKINPVPAMAGVAFFAIFHGHAHGAEMPEIAEPFTYALGFLLGTSGIHLAGVLIGSVSNKIKDGPEILRYIGAGIAGAGVYILHILVKFNVF